MKSASVCTATVPSEPSAGELAFTGLDLTSGLAWASILILTGLFLLLMLRRQQRPRAALFGAGVIVAASIGALGVSDPTPALAVDADTACSLVQIEDITRGDADNLLPGGTPAPVLGYALTNVTTFPINITITTVVGDDPGDVAGLIATVISDPAGPASTGPLDQLPPTAPTRLEPGESVRIGYELCLDSGTGNEFQNVEASFTSTITATQD